MTYTRLDQSAASTDPFCGTFLGSFGGNGPELLQVTRTTDKVITRILVLNMTRPVKEPAMSLM